MCVSVLNCVNTNVCQIKNSITDEWTHERFGICGMTSLHELYVLDWLFCSIELSFIFIVYIYPPTQCYNKLSVGQLADQFPFLLVRNDWDSFSVQYFLIVIFFNVPLISWFPVRIRCRGRLMNSGNWLAGDFSSSFIHLWRLCFLKLPVKWQGFVLVKKACSGERMRLD